MAPRMGSVSNCRLVGNTGVPRNNDERIGLFASGCGVRKIDVE